MKKNTFGNRLQERRLELHCSQDDLSELTGLSYNFIVALEGGRKNPSIKTLVKLTTVLDVSADWLLGIEASEQRKSREARYKYIDEKVGEVSINAQERIWSVVEAMIDYENEVEKKRLDHKP